MSENVCIKNGVNTIGTRGSSKPNSSHACARDARYRRLKPGKAQLRTTARHSSYYVMRAQSCLGGGCVGFQGETPPGVKGLDWLWLVFGIFGHKVLKVFCINCVENGPQHPGADRPGSH